MITRSGIKTIFTTISFGFMLFSAPLFAGNDNRPVMESAFADANTATSTHANTHANTETKPNTMSNINTHTGVDREKTPLSSVELMMQRQASTPPLQLPATEIRPGETITIHRFDKPRRGASMKKVRNELGSPLSTDPAVGKPPITRWIYTNRIVYFEYSSVIDVVAR